ncbi:hypothetical protein C8039_09130 [Halogeometricum sp. wsp3]|nr:hypothetical protein C8039_09130 [Halogeometricum sp. wsp3]
MTDPAVFAPSVRSTSQQALREFSSARNCHRLGFEPSSVPSGSRTWRCRRPTERRGCGPSSSSPSFEGFLTSGTPRFVRDARHRYR